MQRVGDPRLCPLTVCESSTSIELAIIPQQSLLTGCPVVIVQQTGYASDHQTKGWCGSLECGLADNNMLNSAHQYQQQRLG